MLTKRTKRLVKKLAMGERGQRFDRLADSLQVRERTHADGETWVDYGFILPEDIIFDFDPDVTPTEWDAYLDLTDEEINEWIRDNMEVNIYSAYDCTGGAFTRWIDWHRNPCGLISYQHHMGLDI